MNLVSKIIDAVCALFVRSLPGKQSLTRLTKRPPNYETPPTLFRSPITSNEIFFVRYHLPEVPIVDAQNWRLKIGGDGAKNATSIDLDELKSMPAEEIVAVCECSGNQRRFIAPPAPGIQWGHGAIGCARWRGARLKDVLEKAGIRNETIEIAFEGGDEDPERKIEPYIKSIPISKAIENNTLVVYGMNDEPLPHWNGFPARIVVPGWTATYWVKQLRSITALTMQCQSFWMKDDYRVPIDRFAGEAFRSQDRQTDTAVTSILVNSLVTSHDENSKVLSGARMKISGIAWDCGHGIERVEVSNNGGKNWIPAELGQSLGRFAFRSFSFECDPLEHGTHSFWVRAMNANGERQPEKSIPNPAGYHHNAIQKLTIIAGS